MRLAWRLLLQRARKYLNQMLEMTHDAKMLIVVGNSLPLTKELRMDMARFEIPVSGWTCFRTV